MIRDLRFIIPAFALNKLSNFLQFGTSSKMKTQEKPNMSMLRWTGVTGVGSRGSLWLALETIRGKHMPFRA